MSNNWQVKKLGEVLKLEYGKPLPPNKRNPAGAYPVYGANGIKNRTDQFYVEKPSIIIGRKGSAGEINLSEAKFWPLDVTYFVVFDDKEFHRKFLFYLFSTLDLPKLAKGVKPGINRNEVYDIEVPLPPLSEQHRIVAILNEAFAAIDKARENTEKNLKNARELFESYLNSVFENPGEDWGKTTLGKSCDYVNGKAHEQYIDDNGKYIVINSKFISSDGKIYKRTNTALSPLFPDDIVMVLSDVPNGKALAKCYFVEKPELYSLNQRICVIRSKKFQAQFLYYQLNRNKHFLSFNNGENQTNLRLNQVLSCPLFVPPFHDQEKISEKLTLFLFETQKLEAKYKDKIADLNELKKSILKKAFTGELNTGQS